MPWKYIYITVICQFEKSFEKECDWINSPWPFFPRNFSTPDEDCSKSFHIKTFLRIHRCLTHSDLRKRQKEVYQPIIWLFRQHQIFSFSTQFWNRAKIYFRCQPQALGKNPISEGPGEVRSNFPNARPFNFKFLSMIRFPLWKLHQLFKPLNYDIWEKQHLRGYNSVD